jgi:DNA-binding IclR family transcriptional regulator
MNSVSTKSRRSLESTAPSGSQTLFRGLDVLEAVAAGAVSLGELAEKLGLTRSTTHRLASALVERRYLTFAPGDGYRLGAKLLELGYGAHQQMDIPRMARPYLLALADASDDTVHLGILEDWRALYLDKIPGRRRIEISSRVGERHPLTTTGLGKALILDQNETRWRELWQRECSNKASSAGWDSWLKRMRGYAQKGHAFDLEENEDRIRCVAAPIRKAGGGIVAAISVSSAAQYMNDARMAKLAVTVKETCAAISEQFGWQPADTAGESNAPRPSDKGRRRL